MKSASGGVFYGRIRYIINNDGVVWGVEFLNGYDVSHICVSNIADLKIRKWKYVQIIKQKINKF